MNILSGRQSRQDVKTFLASREIRLFTETSGNLHILTRLSAREIFHRILSPRKLQKYFSFLFYVWDTLLVARLVEALLYKPVGRGFYSRWCH
jgi:hypothetical protein